MMRTGGALDRAGVALPRTGDPPDRTGGPNERSRHTVQTCYPFGARRRTNCGATAIAPKEHYA